MAMSERKRLTFTGIAVALVGIVTGLLIGGSLLPSQAADELYNERTTTTTTVTKLVHTHDGSTHTHTTTTIITITETTPHGYFHAAAPAGLMALGTTPTPTPTEDSQGFFPCTVCGCGTCFVGMSCMCSLEEQEQMLEAATR